MHILSVVVARPFLTALVLNETWIVHVAEQQTSKYAGYRTNEPVVELLLQTLVTAGLVRASYPRPCSSARITSLFVCNSGVLYTRRPKSDPFWAEYIFSPSFYYLSLFILDDPSLAAFLS